MSTLIRIFTENKNFSEIEELVGKYFDGATFIKAEGLWRGEREHSLIIEIVTDLGRLTGIKRIERLCYDIKELNNQDTVLVQYIEIQSRLI